MKLILKIIASVVFLAVIVVFTANTLFNQKVKKETREFFTNVDTEADIVQESDLEGLPLCVQKWLKYSQVVGKEKIKTVRLKQKAMMRTEPDKRWMATEVQQYFRTEEPGFVWTAKIKAAPMFHIAGRDMYSEGNGHMLIKLLSLITVADVKGPEIDQGTLLRYLAEMVWFPTAALNDYIKWEEIDANSAKATMSYKGTTASGVFTFNDKGEVISFEAPRYREVNGKYSLENWVVPIKGYGEFNGIKVPTKGNVVWRLKTGDFHWYQWEITGIEYNQAEVY